MDILGGSESAGARPQHFAAYAIRTGLAAGKFCVRGKSQGARGGERDRNFLTYIAALPDLGLLERVVADCLQRHSRLDLGEAGEAGVTRGYLWDKCGKLRG